MNAVLIKAQAEYLRRPVRLSVSKLSKNKADTSTIDQVGPEKVFEELVPGVTTL